MPTTTDAHHRIQFFPWIVWAIAALYFLFDYLQQMAPGVMGASLISAFHVEAAALGTLSAFYFYSYSLMQIPVGLITDHFGPHRPLVAAALVAAGGGVWFATCTSLEGAELSRMLMGAGAAFSYVACLKLISNWFPANRFATMAGMTSFVGMAGAIIGGGPLADSVSAMGWRGTAYLLAGLGVVLAVLIGLVVRDHPSDATQWEHHPDNERGPGKSLQDVKHVLSSPGLWITGLFVTCMNITFTAFGATWGTTYIAKVYGLSQVSAASTVSLLFVGGLVGGPLIGRLSDMLHRRKLPMIAAAAGALVTMSVILYVPGIPRIGMCVLLFLQGAFCNALILGFALGNDIRPPGSAGISVGFVNTCCAGGTALFLPIMGRLSELRVPYGAHDGVADLSAADLRLALSFLLVCLGVALIAALLAPETHCKSLYDTDE